MLPLSRLTSSWISHVSLINRSVSTTSILLPYAKPKKKNQPRRPIPQNHILQEYINENRFYSQPEWDSIKPIITLKKGIDESGFPGYVMKWCLTENKFQTAKSLVEYLNQKNETLNTASLMFLLKLYAVNYEEGDKDGEKFILNTCNELMQENERYHFDLVNACIYALARTKVWRKGIDLMEKIRENGDIPSESAINAFIWAAFKNKQFELGYEQMKKLNDATYNEVIIEWLNLWENGETVSPAFELVDYLSERMLNVPLELVDDIKLNFEKKNYNVETNARISHDGFCSNCKNYLERSILSPADFIRLRDAVMNSVIKGSDVFINSSPKELTKFKQYISRAVPYDIVIDGLNVAFYDATCTRVGRFERRKFNYSGQLVNVVRNLTEVQKKKVIVLGRRHMNHWPGKDISYLKQNNRLFMTDDLSEDDPYMLYATLASGPETLFMSNDFMRNHNFCLSNVGLSRIFKTWQWSHQLRFTGSVTSNQIEILPPVTYKITAQRSQTTIHFPCAAPEHTALSATTLPLPEKWICCNKIN